MKNRRSREGAHLASSLAFLVSFIARPAALQAHDIEECLEDLKLIAMRWNQDPNATQSKAKVPPTDLSLHLVCLSHEGAPLGVVHVRSARGRMEVPVIERNAYVAFVGADQIEELAQNKATPDSIRSLVKAGNIHYRQLSLTRRRDILGDLVPQAIVAGVAFVLALALLIILLLRRARMRPIPDDGAAAGNR